MTQVQQYLTWEQTQYPIQWDNNPYEWEDVFVLIEIAEAVGGGHKHIDAYKNLDKEKRKRVIKLVAVIKGEEYKEEKFAQNDIKITADDIKLVLKEVLQVHINNTQ